MRKWKASLYTAIVKADGGTILHNTFMGAVALIPNAKAIDVPGIFQEGIVEDDQTSADLTELCRQGFFVPEDLDERKVVSDLLQKERESAPFNLIILPHENCNFRCTYCYESFRRGKMTRSVVAGLKLLVRRQIKQSPGLAVAWFGGEPLLGQDVICELSESFISDCEQAGVPYSSHMTTNGYLLTPDVVDSLIKHRVTQFQVTLDGPQATHDRTRTRAGGGSTYRHIINNLTQMRDSPHPFQMTIRVNFSPESIPLMDEFLAETSGLFANDSRFSAYFRPIGKWGGPNDAKLDTCEFHEAADEKARLILRNLDYEFANALVKNALRSHGTVCYAAKDSSIVVGADGTLYKCTLAFEDPRNQVGRLGEDGNLQIDEARWNRWVNTDGLDTSGCVRCPFLPSCQGKSCPKQAIEHERAICSIRPKAEYESMVKAVATAGRQFHSPATP